MSSNTKSTSNTKLLPKRRWRYVLAVLVVCLVGIIGLAYWLLATSAGTHFVLSTLQQTSNSAVQFDSIEGRLLGPLRVKQLTLQSQGVQTELHEVQLDWQPQALLHGQLHVTSLRVESIRIRQRIDQPSEPAALPTSLALPLSVRIDRLHIDGGSLAWGALDVIELGAFTLHLEYEDGKYQLALEQFSAQAGVASSVKQTKGATRQNFHGTISGQAELADTRPFQLNATLSANLSSRLEQKELSGSGKMTLDGSLEQLQAKLDLTVGEARLNGRATVRPFSALPLLEAEVDAEALDLATLNGALPHTLISGKFTATEKGGTLVLKNQDAGTYDVAHLPLTSASAKFRQNDQGLHFDEITAQLGSNNVAAGLIQGSGRFAKGALNLDFTTRELNLHQLDSRLLTTRLEGSAKVRHQGKHQEFSLDLSEPLQSRRLALSAQATIADTALSLDRVELSLGKAQLRANGHLQLSEPRAFKAKGTLSRFRLQDLGQFTAVPELYLNGDFSLTGALGPKLTADLDFHITDSLMAGQPLQGEGRARLRADSLDIPKLTLAAGSNKLEVSGQLQPNKGQLAFSLTAPKLAELGPGFSGSLQIQGTARGSFTRPRILAEWQVNQIQLQSLLKIASASGKGELELDRTAPWLLGGISLDSTAQGVHHRNVQLESLSTSLRFAPSANAPLALKVQAKNIGVTNYHADTLSLEASGTTGRHTLLAQLSQAQQQWRLQVSGALQAKAPSWQGQIEQLSGSGSANVKLANAAPLEISRERILLQGFRLSADRAVLNIEQLRRDRSGLQTRGRFEHLPLAELLPYLQPQLDVTTDLLFAGEWDITLAGLTQLSRGNLSVRRESGDLATRGLAPVKLGLERLEANVRTGSDRLQIQVHAEGSNLGKIDVDAGLALQASSSSNFGISPQSALTGNATLSVPSLRWIAPLVASGAITEGGLAGTVRLAGTVAAPSLGGTINGQDLRLALPDLGVDLRGGSLDASFQDTRLLIQNLGFNHNGGSITGKGLIDFTNAHPELQVTLKAARYPLLTRIDRKLVVSGDGEIKLHDGKLQITGGLNADSGLIDIGQANKPTLSDDVVIVGESTKKAAIPLALDVVIGLGEGIVIRGYGLNASLVGQVQFRNGAGEPLKAQGAMRVISGTVSAYGRELEIEKGLLYFNGSPGNPGLDILAMRRGQSVEAGVAVLGTALAPRIVLVSEPAVSEADKLSWLVLGRGLDASTGGGDLAALQNAAAALLAQGAAAGVQAGLAGSLGLDELSLGTSKDSLQQRIVTIGKQVSSRLHIGIEQGLEATSSVLLLRYTISRKLSLEIEAGTRTAFTLFYNFAFD